MFRDLEMRNVGMNARGLLIFPILLFLSFGVVRAGEICKESAIGKDSAISSLCLATPDSFDGFFVLIEDGFFPIPSGFYIKPKHQNYILMDSALTKSRRSGWSYGILIIGDAKTSRLGSASEVHKVENHILKDFEKKCEIPVDLWQVKFELPDSDYSTQFAEARIGETVILIGGESIKLMLAMLDAYERINCEN